MIHASQTHSNNQKERDYLEGWQRARAELANIQKRLVDEQLSQRRNITKDVTQALLAVADNFQAIVQHVPEEINNHAWTEGVLHVARQLEGVLADFGVTIIEAKGQSFNPVLHEAIEQKKAKNVAPGTIIEVLQPGYKMNGDVLRPARVRVAK